MSVTKSANCPQRTYVLKNGKYQLQCVSRAKKKAVPKPQRKAVPQTQPSPLGLNIYGLYGLSRGPHAGGGTSLSYCMRLSQRSCFDVGAGFDLSTNWNPGNGDLKIGLYNFDSEEGMTTMSIQFGLMGFLSRNFGIGLYGAAGYAFVDGDSIRSEAVIHHNVNPLSGFFETQGLKQTTDSYEDEGAFYRTFFRVMHVLSNYAALYGDFGLDSLPPVGPGNRGVDFGFQSGLRVMF